MDSESGQPRRIVVGIDFSPASVAAARWSVRWLAKDAELVLVHTLIVPEMSGILGDRFPLSESLLANARAGAERRLRDLSLSLRSPRIWIEIREGRPAEAIAEVARDYGAELVVVGKHGEGSPHRGYTGRTADRLVRTSPAAVLLASGMSGEAPAKIVVPLTYSSITPFIVDWTRRVYELSGADVVVVHVVGAAVLSHVLTMAAVKTGEALNSEQIDDVFSDERAQWKKDLVTAGIPAERITAEVVFGEVSDAVLAAVQQHRADMVVMGSHAGPVRRLLLGSAASAILRQADIPVLIVVEPEEKGTPDNVVAEESTEEFAAIGPGEFK